MNTGFGRMIQEMQSNQQQTPCGWALFFSFISLMLSQCLNVLDRLLSCTTFSLIFFTSTVFRKQTDSQILKLVECACFSILFLILTRLAWKNQVKYRSKKKVDKAKSGLSYYKKKVKIFYHWKSSRTLKLENFDSIILSCDLMVKSN